MPQTSRNSLKKNIFDKHPEDKLYEELNYTTINDIYNKLNTYSQEKETTMLILDDVGAVLKDTSIQTIFRKIIYNRRHLNVVFLSYYNHLCLYQKKL